MGPEVRVSAGSSNVRLSEESGCAEGHSTVAAAVDQAVARFGGIDAAIRLVSPTGI